MVVKTSIQPYIFFQQIKIYRLPLSDFLPLSTLFFSKISTTGFISSRECHSSTYSEFTHFCPLRPIHESQKQLKFLYMTSPFRLPVCIQWICLVPGIVMAALASQSCLLFFLLAWRKKDLLVCFSLVHSLFISILKLSWQYS